MKTPKTTPTTGHLAKLIAEYEHKLDALRTTAALLNGHATNGKVARADSVLAGALQADAARRSNWGGARPKRSEIGKHSTAQVQKRRKATLRFLAKVAKAKDGYRGNDIQSHASLILHGYIKKQGDGYVRTDKIFTP